MSAETSSSESPGFNVTVSLAGNAVEVLEQLFFQGPTWDGNIISKSGRDDLFDLKLAGRVEGYSFLTAAGVRLALQNRVERKKEKRERQRGEWITRYHNMASIVNPEQCGQAQTIDRPTVEELERLLRTEDGGAAGGPGG
jgi:hypothetical protein